MKRYLVKRLGLSILVLLAAALISFAIIRFLPGNPAELVLGENATPERIAAME